jgi:drug/metabolite transporter (DMT)-like permease
LLGVGEGLALLSGFSYAAAGVAIAKSAQSKGGDNGALLSIIITVLMSCSVWIVSQAAHSAASQNYNLPGLGWFALSGLLTIVVGRALFFESIARLGAIRASAVNRLNPFFSVLLAAALLGERLVSIALIGMLLIAVSFALLVKGMLSKQQNVGAAGPGGRAISVSAYTFGAASAFAYALGYTTRKFGLFHIPDASFGTLVGAVIALSTYLVIAPFVGQYRNAVRKLLSETTRWNMMAAVLISIGQIAQFGAIKYIEVSRVVMITSIEVFISMFLSVYVFRTEQRPDMRTLIAAVLASIGVVLITLG